MRRSSHPPTLLPIDQGEEDSPGTGRTGRARHPHRHVARTHGLRQGSDRRRGGQGGRVPLREHRPDAAQLRDRQAGLDGGARQDRGGDRDQIPTFQARHFVPKSNKVLLASTLLQPRETQKLELHRAERAGRLSLCLHLSRPLDAHARRALRRREPGRVSGQSRSVSGQEPAQDRGPAAEGSPAAHRMEVRGAGLRRSS